MSKRAFTVIELLVVVGIIAIIAAISFPVFMAQAERAHVEEMRSQLRTLDAALSQYHTRSGDYPLSFGTGDNAGIETMLAALRSKTDGGPFIQEHLIQRWLSDGDGDGLQELVDPWRMPWIYFHPASYTSGKASHRSGEKTFEAEPVKKRGAFRNLTKYQLWACGPNSVNESGEGDDVGNVLK